LIRETRKKASCPGGEKWGKGRGVVVKTLEQAGGWANLICGGRTKNGGETGTEGSSAKEGRKRDVTLKEERKGLCDQGRLSRK